MASSPKLSSILLFLCFFSSFISMSMATRPLLINSKSTLFDRLKLDEDEGSSACWDSLFELQSCTGEVVLFFLNGETYLGPNCCRAIRTIQNQCWPTMLGSIGIDNEECDILMGYCGAADDDDSDTGAPQVNTTTGSHVITP